MKKNYEEMTVKELREESKSRNMTLEYKGHKFTKAELIERLKNNDAVQKDIDDDIQKAIEEAGEPERVETNAEHEETKETETNPVKPAKERTEGYIARAFTIEDFKKRYGNRKPQKVYDKELAVGSLVVFIECVEAQYTGEIFEKMRTAKVTAVNRKRELVKAVTTYGKEFTLSFDDLLYIRADNEYSSYPKDIAKYLQNQRQRNKERRMKRDERFAKKVVTD